MSTFEIVLVCTFVLMCNPKNCHPLPFSSGMYPEIDPFTDNRGGIEDWEKIYMVPGSALFIPKGWLHCIKSEPGSLALSIQVEGYKPCRQMVESQIESTIIEQSIADFATWSDASKSGHSHSVDTSCKAKSPDEDAHRPAPSKPGHTTENSSVGVIAKIGQAVVSTSSEHLVRGENSVVAQANIESAKMTKRKACNAGSENKLIRIKRHSNGTAHNQQMLRKSNRTILKCGICSRGFGGEMWLLYFQGPSKCQSTRALPLSPTILAKHLVCMECRPRGSSRCVSPREKIIYPDGECRPILTKEEFVSGNSSMLPIDLDEYKFIAASYTDYETQILNNGKAQWGKAGQGLNSDQNEKLMAIDIHRGKKRNK